ncbi:MAG: ABC transporter ATP-binding protein, partial [Chloroflexi bacterium]|nr:ABC transporter ATP-binding protein [Chloroflexota bacterium]
RSGDNETYALRDVSLTIKQGEFVVLRGPSGSGKSSMLYILSALRSATSGKIRFGEHQYGTESADNLTRLRRVHFGFIFQFHFLISYLTVLENVMVAAPEQNTHYQAKALDFLDSLGIGKVAHRMPHQVSGGQRQRVAVARALIHDPQVIFADEPTASLNTEAGLDVMRLLAEHRGERTVIMVTHDDTMSRFANRAIELRDGVVVNDGPNPAFTAAASKPAAVTAAASKPASRRSKRSTSK